MPTKFLTCIEPDCGKGFEFSERDQEFYETMGFLPPKRCFECRNRKKSRFGKDRNSNHKRKSEV